MLDAVKELRVFGQHAAAAQDRAAAAGLPVLQAEFSSTTKVSTNDQEMPATTFVDLDAILGLRLLSLNEDLILAIDLSAASGAHLDKAASRFLGQVPG